MRFSERKNVRKVLKTLFWVLRLFHGLSKGYLFELAQVDLFGFSSKFKPQEIWGDGGLVSEFLAAVQRLPKNTSRHYFSLLCTLNGIFMPPKTKEINLYTYRLRKFKMTFCSRKFLFWLRIISNFPRTRTDIPPKRFVGCPRQFGKFLRKSCICLRSLCSVYLVFFTFSPRLSHFVWLSRI